MNMILGLFGMLYLLGSTFLTASISTCECCEIEAVIFDCDGILVDTEYLKFLAWQEALAAHGIAFTIEEYKPLVGHSSKNILGMLRQLKDLNIPEEVIELKNTRYRILQKAGVPSIEEIVAFARHLGEQKQKLGIKLGVASSACKKEILQNLQQIGLEDVFDVVISGSDDLDDYEDQEGKNKPKPYIYLEAAKQLNVSPLKCMAIEDTEAGIEAAFSAGMIAIAVPNQFTASHDFSKAAKIIDSYKNLSKEIPFLTIGEAIR